MIQKGLDEETDAHCQKQLRLCLMRSGAKHKLAFGNDPRHINVPGAHAWLRIHIPHTLQRCDVAIYCRKFCGDSAVGKTATLIDPCNPAIAAPGGKSEENNHHLNMLAKLSADKCPYSSSNGPAECKG